MNEYELLLLIVGGGLAVPTTVFLIARHLVYRQSDPAAAAAYWAARNARHAEEVAPLLRPARRATTQRPKELTR